MKTLMSIVLLSICILSFGQQRYRISKFDKAEAQYENQDAWTIIAHIERMVDAKVSYLSSMDLFNISCSDPTKDISKLKKTKSIGPECYLKEYNQQIIRLDSINNGNKCIEKYIINDNIDSLKYLYDKYIPIKRIIEYTSSNSVYFKENIDIVITKLSVGGNANLGIVPKTTYRLQRLSGSFLDIFPIWSKIFDKSAKQESYENTQKGGWYRILIIENKNITAKLINSGGGYWEIFIN